MIKFIMSFLVALFYIFLPATDFYAYRDAFFEGRLVEYVVEQHIP